MSQSPQSPDNRDPAPTESTLVKESGSTPGGTPTWQAPWVANATPPEGAADVPTPAESAPGHYGPGYADPTRHYGDAVPGQPAQRAPGTAASTGTPSTSALGSAAQERSGSSAPDWRNPAPTQDPERAPDFRSEEVGLRPPDQAPSSTAPASENASLLFERS